MNTDTILIRAPTILLIAFKFPPYPGVGGNRWMHLSKYLSRLGCRIHVVTVHWRGESGSPWGPSIADGEVTIHRIPSGFPHNVYYRRPRNRLLKYIARVMFSRHVLRRIWWDDEAQHWGLYLIPYCQKLARRVDLDVIVATGHPFEANYLAAGLARKLGLPLVQDLRDPWVDNPYAKYTQRQRHVLVQRVRTALQSCDRVVAVTQGLLDVYGQYCDLTAKGMVIRNGHDIEPDSSRGGVSHGLKSGGPFCTRLVYVGNVSNGREEPFEWLLDAITTLRRHDRAEIHVDVYSLEREKLEQRYSQFVRIGSLILCTPVAHGDIAEVLRKYDAAIHLTARAFPYAASTKVYEYGASRIPTISLNYGGEAEQLISELDCGVSINLSEGCAYEALGSAIANLGRGFAYRVEKFHWRELARSYCDLVSGVLRERDGSV